MEKSTQAEEELIRRAAHCGDDGAFCSLMELHRRHLGVIVARFASCQADREDLQSEVIERLLANDRRALKQWKPIASFRAYLTTIAVRHCITWLQRRTPEVGPSLLPGSHEGDNRLDLVTDVAAADTKDVPDSVIDQIVTREILHDALMELSPPDRLVLALRFEEGMNGPTIARVLGISHNAVRQRVFKALRRLTEVLETFDHGLTP